MIFSLKGAPPGAGGDDGRIGETSTQERIWRWLGPEGTEIIGSQTELLARIKRGALPVSTLVRATAEENWVPVEDIPDLLQELTLIPNSRAPSVGRYHTPQARAVPISSSPAGAREESRLSSVPNLAVFGDYGRSRRNTPIQMHFGEADPVSAQITRRAPQTPSTQVAAKPTAERVTEDNEATTVRFATGETPLSGSAPAIPARRERRLEIDGPRARNELSLPVGDRVTLDSLPPSMRSADHELDVPRSLNIRLAFAVVASCSVSLVLTFALIGSILWRKGATNPSLPAAAPGAAASSVATPAAEPEAPRGCTSIEHFGRLAPSVERSVPILVSAGAADTLAVGFAASKIQARGLTLRGTDLERHAVYEEDGARPLRGIVPVAGSFWADREQPLLKSARSLEQSPRLLVGLSETGISRLNQGGKPELIWPLDHRLSITEPRTAKLGADLHALAIRRGTQSNAQIMLGFIRSDGTAASELHAVPNTPAHLGTPHVAVDGERVLLSFAGRASESEPWRIFVSEAQRSGAPGAARALSVTAAGLGALSPSAAALPGGRWAFQWTQGTSAEYQVRVQAFDAEFSALGSPLSVSPKGVSASQGSIASLGNSAVTLYVLAGNSQDELWGATLRCQ